MKTFLMMCFSFILLKAAAQNLAYYPSILKSGTDGSISSIDLNFDGEVEVAVMGKDENGYNFTNFYTWNNGAFVELPINITQVSKGDFTWLDFNLDQQIDLLLTGYDVNGKIVAEFYQNNGNFQLQKTSIAEVSPMATVNPVCGDFNQDGFTELIITGVDQNFESRISRYQFEKSGVKKLPIDLPAIAFGRLLAIDANRDGAEDLIISGLNSVNGKRITHLYQNNGSGNFFLKQDNFAQLAHTTLATIDIHRDGFEDFLITGFDIDGNKKGELYFNHEGQFSNTETFDLPDLSHAAMAVTDINLDGWDDLIISGNNSFFEPTSYFFLNQSGTLIQKAPFLPNLEKSMLITLDLDGSGNSDLIFTGRGNEQPQSGFYLNHTIPKNSPPTPVKQVQCETIGNDLMISWSDAEDDLSIPSTLKYLVGVKNMNGDFQFHQEWIRENEVMRGNKLPLISKNWCLLKNIGAGDYLINVFAIDQQGVASTVYNLNYQHCPAKKILQDTTVCPGNILSFNIESSPEATNWYVQGATLPIPGNLFSSNFDSLTEVRVEFTESTGCKYTDTMLVNVFPKPGIDLPEYQEICAGDQVFWDADSGFISFDAFFKGESLEIFSKESVFFRPDSEGIFTIYTQDQNGCYDSAQSTIKIEALPEFNLPPYSEICQEDSFKLPQYADLELNWQIDQTEDGYFKPSEPISLLIGTAKNSAGCQISDTTLLTVLPLPGLNLPDTFWTCPGDTFKLAITNDPRYLKLHWSTNQDPSFDYHGLSPTLIVNQPQDLTLFIEDENGCNSREVISLQTYSVSSFDLGEDTAICVNEPHVLVTMHENQMHKWWINDRLVTTEQFNFLQMLITEDHQVICETVDENGCRFRDSVAIEAKNLPSPMLPDTAALCLGDSLILPIPEGVLLIWVDSGNEKKAFQNSLKLLPENSFYLVAELIGSNGCHSIDSGYINVNMLPTPLYPFDTVICENSELILSQDENLTINWLSEEPPLLFDSVFKYRVVDTITLPYQIIDQNLCSQYSTLTINSYPLPEIDVESSLQVCQLDTFKINLNLNDSMNWWINNKLLINGPEFSMCANENTELKVNVVNKYGCHNEKNIIVNVIQLPVIDAGQDQTICNDGAANLKANLGADISDFCWMNMGNDIVSDAEHFDFYPTHSENLILYVKDNFGCENTDTVSITINADLKLSVSSDTIICDGSFLELNVENKNQSLLPVNFTWHDEDLNILAQSSKVSVSPSQSTFYNVVGQAGGCKPDTVKVKIDVKYGPSLHTRDSIIVGMGEEIVLTATGAKTYLWEPERNIEYHNTANPIVTPSQNQTYYVHGFNDHGCESIDSVTIIVKNSIFIPDYFSPDQDGVNEAFKLYGSGIKEIDFKILSLNGKELFVTNDPALMVETGWDGKFEGNPLPAGAYLWQLTGQFQNGAALAYRGRNSGVFYLVR